DQYQLTHQSIELRSMYHSFYKKNNQYIDDAFQSICYKNQDTYKKLETNYEILKKRINAIEKQTNKPIQLKNTNKEESESTFDMPPLRPGLTPTEIVRIARIKMKATLSALTGTLALGVASAAFAFITFPLGLFLGGCFTAFGFISLIGTVLYCKRTYSD